MKMTVRLVRVTVSDERDKDEREGKDGGRLE
jgi:hypothetical protein